MVPIAPSATRWAMDMAVLAAILFPTLALSFKGGMPSGCNVDRSLVR